MAAAWRLLALAASISSDPYEQATHSEFYAGLFAIRGESLLLNFLHSLTSPGELGPLIAVRPLVELAIRSKWVSLDPELHGERWLAHSEQRDLIAIRGLLENIGPRVNPRLPEEFIAAQVELKTQLVDAVKRKPGRDGRVHASPLPDLAEMVREISKAEPEESLAMHQAYDGTYRGFSPWAHAEAASFKAGVITAEGGSRFEGDISPFDVGTVLAVAGSMFAYVLEILASARGEYGIEHQAREIRTLFTGRQDAQSAELAQDRT